VTVVDLTEETARAVDWDSVDLAQLLAASLQEPPQMTLTVSSQLEQIPAYRRALAKARALASGDS
jgi:hypothetical protein